MGACSDNTMAMITDLVFLVRLAVFVTLFTSCACNRENNINYCEKDQDRCDDDGIYKYFGVTNFDDSAIRDILDDDFELINIRPKLAVKKTEKTLKKYPNSPRAILNKALALRNANAQGEGTLPYPEYFAESMNLYSRITALPLEKITAGLLNHACELWFGLATSTEITQTIIEVTTACLNKNVSLGNDIIFSLRASQAINLFSAKNYKECLNSMDTFYATVADVQQKTGKTLTPQPFLKMVQLAANKILQNEIDQSSIESMQQIFDILRAEDPETLQQQKDKYDLFVEQCKEKEFKDESMRIMYEVGVDAGLYLSKYQKPTEIVPGLRSKVLWDLEDLEPGTVKMIKRMKESWETILAEGMELKAKESRWMEDKRLLEDGSWNQLSFIGKSVDKNNNPSISEICSNAPTTCAIVTGNPSAFCPTCTSKWSVLGPNSHISPHCGPTNARLRIHLGLKVPEGCAMNIGETRVTWRKGEVMVFDDSFEHEVWNNSTEDRMIFILDIFHPDLTESQKKEDLFKIIL